MRKALRVKKRLRPKLQMLLTTSVKASADLEKEIRLGLLLQGNA
jgi:hypothetical protein